MKKKIQNKIMRWLGVHRYFVYFYNENIKLKDSVERFLSEMAEEQVITRRKIDQLIEENASYKIKFDNQQRLLALKTRFALKEEQEKNTRLMSLLEKVIKKIKDETLWF